MLRDTDEGCISKPKASKINERHSVALEMLKLGTHERQSEPPRFLVHTPALVERANKQVMRKRNPRIRILKNYSSNCSLVRIVCRAVRRVLLKQVKLIGCLNCLSPMSLGIQLLPDCN